MTKVLNVQQVPGQFLNGIQQTESGENDTIKGVLNVNQYHQVVQGTGQFPTNPTIPNTNSDMNNQNYPQDHTNHKDEVINITQQLNSMTPFPKDSNQS